MVDLLSVGRRDRIVRQLAGAVTRILPERELIERPTRALIDDAGQCGRPPGTPQPVAPHAVGDTQVAHRTVAIQHHISACDQSNPLGEGRGAIDHLLGRGLTVRVRLATQLDVHDRP